LGKDFFDNTRYWGGNLCVDFVGGNFDQWFVHGDGVTDIF
jgi:hypothetical protein